MVFLAIVTATAGAAADYSDCDVNLTECLPSAWVADTVYCFNVSSWGAAGSCFQIDADNVTFDCKGNTLTGDGTGVGVYANDRVNLTIRNCILNEFEYGILLNDTEDSLLENNTLNDNIDAGIQLQYCDEVNVTSNYANSTNEGNGITLIDSSDNLIDNNSADSNYYVGIGLYDDSDSNVIDGNTVQNSGYPGIFLNASDDNNITSNTANNNGEENTNNGIYLYNSTGNLIYNNTVENNTWAGIQLLDGSDNNNVTENLEINGNDWYGIYIENSSINAITDNELENNDYGGIILDNSGGNTIVGNAVDGGSSFYGIAVFESSENNLTGNTANGSAIGLILFFSGDNIVDQNNLTNNSYYSLLEGSSGDCNNVDNDSNIGGDDKPILYWHDDTGLTLEDTDAYSEIIFCNVNDSTIENVTVYNPETNSDGILLVYSYNDTVRLSNATAVFAGITLYNSHDTLVENNTLVSNRFGVTVLNVDDDFIANLSEGDGGGFWILSDNGRRTESQFGIETMTANFKTLTVISEILTEDDGQGDFFSIESVPGFNDFILALIASISDEGNNTIANNTGLGNLFAGLMLASSNNTVYNNNLTVNLFSGTSILLATGNNLTGNTLDRNAIYGLYTWMTADNFVGSNEVCYNNELDMIDANSTETGENNTCDSYTGWADEGVDEGCANLCTGVDVEKTANVSTVSHGDTIEWTINVTNVGISTLNVSLTDSNGHSFDLIENLTPGSYWNGTYTTTAGYCDITNLIIADGVNEYEIGHEDNDSASVDVRHCGDGRCNCGESERSCSRDCEGSGTISGFIMAPPKEEPPVVEPVEEPPVMSTTPDEPKVGETIEVIVTNPDGTPATGAIVITSPGGETTQIPLLNGVAHIPASQSGRWTISYTYEGGTLTESVTASEVETPIEAPQSTGGDVEVPKPKGDGIPWVWVAIAIVAAALVLILVKKSAKPKRK